MRPPNYSGNKKRREEEQRKKQEEKRNRRFNKSKTPESGIDAADAAVVNPPEQGI